MAEQRQAVSYSTYSKQRLYKPASHANDVWACNIQTIILYVLMGKQLIYMMLEQQASKPT